MLFLVGFAVVLEVTKPQFVDVALRKNKNEAKLQHFNSCIEFVEL